MKNIFQIVCVGVLTVLAVSAFSSVVSAQDVKGQETDAKGQIIRTPSGLPVKLVVARNSAVYRPKLEEAKEERIPVLSFYWQMKPEEGRKSGSDTYYRFGTPDGVEIGWIKKDYVVQWKTLFCFQPKGPTDNSYFCVKNPTDVEGKSLAGIEKIDMDRKFFEDLKDPTTDEYKGIQLCYITDVLNGKQVPIEVSKDPLKVALGLIPPLDKKDETGDAPKVPVGQQVDIQKLGVDFVFVIDTSGSMAPAINACRSVMKDTVTELSGKEILKDNIRFGLVEYRDVDSYVSKTTQALTNDYAKFQNVLDNLDVNGGGDEAEEGLAGLKEAIDNAGWEKNSMKFLFLIGDAPLKGKGEKSAGKSGLSFDDIKKLAAPVITEAKRDPNGGTVEVQTALAAMNILSMFAVSDETAGNPGVPEGKEQFKRLCNLKLKDGKDAYIEVDLRGVKMENIKKLPVMEDIKKLAATFDTYETVVTTGSIGSKGGDGSAVGTVLAKILPLLSDAPIILGQAADQGEMGEQTAIKKVLMLHTELQRFVWRLSEFNKEIDSTDFSKANKQEVIEKAMQHFTGNISGSKIDKEVNISESFKKDMPLIIRAFEQSPRAIAAKGDNDFDKWHKELIDVHNSLRQICDEKDDPKTQWTELVYPEPIKKIYRERGYGTEKYALVDAYNWNK